MIAGRSRQKRALTGSAPCPDGTVATAWADAPGLPAGGSDCSVGPFGTGAGAVVAAGGVMFWAGPGGTDGTSFGGRTTGNPLKDCAAAGADTASTAPASTHGANMNALPVLVPAIPMGGIVRPKSRQKQASGTRACPGFATK